MTRAAKLSAEFRLLDRSGKAQVTVTHGTAAPYIDKLDVLRDRARERFTKAALKALPKAPRKDLEAELQRIAGLVLIECERPVEAALPTPSVHAEASEPATPALADVLSHLLPQHRKLVLDSGISPEVAAERGYASITVKAEIQRLGFSEAQRRTPALYLPVRGVSGEIVSHQIRPDTPRVNPKGKLIKYETPKGSRMAIDVPPRVRAHLRDPKIPLVITEGIRKADSAASKDIACISLLGVWNFRGTNELGGKTVLPDWESIALNGRDVYIAFDSDVTIHPSVNEALRRLKAFLESRGARVWIVYLPPGEHGEKVGLDDFLATGKSWTDLVACARRELPPKPATDDTPGLIAPVYRTLKDGIVRVGHDKEGNEQLFQVTNFTAKITAQVIRDDGAETIQHFEITVEKAALERSVEIPAATFSSMDWVAEQLGPHFLVTAGNGSRDHARAAIQLASHEAVVRIIYTHTGWREIDGKPAYLHAGGAIGADGVVENINVHLDPPMDRFELPAPPEGDDLVRAVRESLALLDGLAANTTMFPLFSFLWTTVIRPLVEALHITGKTGARKTELLALAQRHHGETMDAKNLPLSWSSTANSIEHLSFVAKDALLGIDDYCPSGSATDVQRQNKDADRVIRGRGNSLGRTRLRSDGTMRPPKPPRSGIASTGEDIPAGHSLRARMITLEVAEGEVNLDKLTERQAAGSWYAKAMAGFVRWLAPRRSSLLPSFDAEVAIVRRALLAHLPHGRTATAGAELMLGLRVYLGFAAEVGAIDKSQAQELDRRGRKAIRATLAKQAEHQAASDPALLFIQSVGAALLAGDVHLAAMDTGGVPADEQLARATGWQRAEKLDGQSPGAEWRQRGSQIGWVDADADAVYLIPAAAYRAAQKQAETSPTRIGIGERSLWERLDEAKLLISKDPDRRTKKTRIGKHAHSLLHLSLSHLLGVTGTTGTDDGNPVAGATGADSHPTPVPEPACGTGTANGNKPASGTVPIAAEARVPDVPVPGEHETTAANGHAGGMPAACANGGAFDRQMKDLFDLREVDDVG